MIKNYYPRLKNFLGSPLIALAVIFLLSANRAGAAAPVIGSVVLNHGIPGDTITINGSNFDATPANNIVYFGATKATVLTATTTQLKVTEPMFSTTQQITVLNTTTHLVGFEQYPFMPEYDNSCFIPNTLNFRPQQQFSTGAGATSSPYIAAIGDIDGDGKADLVAIDYMTPAGKVEIYRNTSTPGSVSFASVVSYATGSHPINLKLADLDGDGKLDVVIAGLGSGVVSLFRNLSTPGTISLSTRTNYTSSFAGPGEVVVADFDGDGHPDIAYITPGNDSVGVLRNTITTPLAAGAAFSATTSFATYIHFLIAGAIGNLPESICVADFDGDGKPDIAASINDLSIISLLRNNSTSGSISFATHVDISTGTSTGPLEIQGADIDGDGMPEIIIANATTSTIGVFLNQSTSGTFSFASPVNFSAASGTAGLSVADLDGDGKLDIAVSNVTFGNIYVYRNTSTVGSITSSSLATPLNLISSASPIGVSIGDIDGDKKPDIVVANTATSHSISVFLNNPLPYVAIIQGSANLCIGTPATLTDSISGGTWSMSNNTTATINPVTGVISPLSLGTDTAIYRVICQGDTNYAMLPVNVTTVPVIGVISGSTHMCRGATITLTDTTVAGSWSSSAPGISSVIGGVVTGLTVGHDTIFYSKSNFCGTGKAYILDTVLTQPTAITGTLNLCAGNSVTLTDTITGGTWSSTATGVATIGALSGQLNGLTRGNTTISYTYTPGGCYVTAVAHVDSLPTMGAITGFAGVCNGSGITLSDTSVGGTWSTVAGTGSVTVSSTGLVTGLTVGTATVSYAKTNACGTNATSFVVTVYSAPSAIGGSLSVCPGTSSTLTDTVSAGYWSITGGHAGINTSTGMMTGSTPGTGTVTFTSTAGGCSVSATYTVYTPPSTISGTPLVCAGSQVTFSDGITGGTWSSSDTTRATIDPSLGIITGIAVGSPVISYTMGTTGCFTTMTLSVLTQPAAITGPSRVCVGSSISLGDITTGTFLWSTGSTGIATVNSSTGLTTGQHSGVAIITYELTSSGCRSYDTITVNPVPAPITGTPHVCVGAVTTLTDTTSGVTWFSSATGIATVTATGIVTGVTNGTALISDTLATGCRSTMLVTVNLNPAAITGPSTICQTASATLTDGSGSGTWTSGAGATATVGSSSGMVTGLLPGTATITFTLPSTCSTTTSITVLAGPNAIIGASQVCLGSTLSLYDSTAAGTWSSSGSAATVDASGVVTGHSVGTVAISYTAGSFSCVAVDSVTVLPIVTPSVTFTASPSLTVCAGTPVTFSATPTFGGATPVYNWSVNGGFAGTGYTYTYAPSNGDVIQSQLISDAACAIPATATYAVVMVVNPLITPLLNLNILLGDTVCLGSPTTVHAIPTNGGTAPTYQWMVNHVPVGGTNSFGYVPANGDIVNCAMESNANCLAVDTAYDSLVITVSPYVSPTVTISGSDTACVGYPAIFYAVPTNAGFYPTYQWSLNGSPASTANPYIYSASTGDLVTVSMTSDFACVNFATAIGDTLDMTLFPVQAPIVHVQATPGSIVAPGMTAHFVAHVTNVGMHPTYQWYRNTSVIPGATDTVYSTNVISNHDSFSLAAINHDVCNGILGFDYIVITIGNNVGVPDESVADAAITIAPNPNTGKFSVKGNIGINADEDMKVTVTNMLGQVVYNDVLKVKNGVVNENILLDNAWSSGMYMLNLHSEHYAKIIHFAIER